MAPLRGFAVASALLAGIVSSQTDSDNSKVWATVAFINHGEKVPDMFDLRTVLTPEGAQQMWRQGNAFRTRYLADSDTGSESSQIQNIEANTLHNDQLTILSQTDEWVVGGAMAFMQGLYPPANQTSSSSEAETEIAANFLDGANSTSYPLNNYQYPRIQTLSTLDSESTVLQGTVGCFAWEKEMNAGLTRQDNIVSMANEAQSFYDDLFGTAPLKGTLDMGYVNLRNASEVYDFVNYMYTHNQTVHDNLHNATYILGQLEQYAFDLERAMNSEVSSDKEDELNILYTIAGRTLAQQVAEQFVSNIGADGVTTKLTLMFGSLRPMMSFFSLADLFTRENLIKGPFNALPEPGAAMVFELFGEDPDHPDQMPTSDNLNVRFYYRATADEDETFELYSLFDTGFGGTSLPYQSFVSEMQDPGKNAGEWCNICQTGISIGWCDAYLSSDEGDDGDKTESSSSGGSSGLNPAVAGVIGAIVTAAVIGLAGLALFALFGFRIQRKPLEERKTSLGGFKGAEKMASDTDLAVTKGGAGHERVGSWELRDGDEQPTTHAGIVTSDFGRNVNDDGVSVLNETPVKAREDV